MKQQQRTTVRAGGRPGGHALSPLRAIWSPPCMISRMISGAGATSRGLDTPHAQRALFVRGGHAEMTGIGCYGLGSCYCGHIIACFFVWPLGFCAARAWGGVRG